jgi:hypothetical protein
MVSFLNGHGNALLEGGLVQGTVKTRELHWDTTGVLEDQRAPDGGRNHGRDNRIASDWKAEIDRNTHREGQKHTFIATMII